MSYVFARPRRFSGLGDVSPDKVWAMAGKPVGYETWDVKALGPPDTASIRSSQLINQWFVITSGDQILSLISPDQDAIPALQSAGLPVSSPYRGADYEFNVLWTQAFAGPNKDDYATGKISIDDLRSQILAQMKSQGWTDADLARLTGPSDVAGTLSQVIQNQGGIPDMRSNQQNQQSPAPSPYMHQSDYQQGAAAADRMKASGAFTPGSSYYLKTPVPQQPAMSSQVQIAPTPQVQIAPTPPAASFAWFSESMIGGIPNWGLVAAAVLVFAWGKR